MAAMDGRVCVVTGASGGIGKAAAAGLARLGATVVIVVRRPDAGREVVAEIRRATPGADVQLVLANLSAQAQVRRAAGEILSRVPRVDVLLNNAAVYTAKRQVTEDGIEMQWAVNHLAPFLLTHLLLDRLKASAPARVVTVSSQAHRRASIDWTDPQMERRYQGFLMYGRTKLANLLFTRELARRLDGAGVTANALHPGVVATSLLLNGFPPIKLFRRFLRTPEQGADTPVWLASSPEAAGVTGQYFIDRRPVEPSRAAQDDESARRLWRWSEEMTGLA